VRHSGCQSSLSASGIGTATGHCQWQTVAVPVQFAGGRFKFTPSESLALSQCHCQCHWQSRLHCRLECHWQCASVPVRLQVDKFKFNFKLAAALE